MSFLRLSKECFAVASLITIVMASAAVVTGQSLEQDFPTPVRSYEIRGAIPALDVGDARLTRHFYAFTATHGDLLVTVESKNLNGDVDIFTAVTMKPLMKIPMYSQESSSMTTKSIYMRAEDILILRVEARSPNDDNGLYHIRFGGAFAPFNGGIPVAPDEETTEPEKSAKASPRRGTTRVSSVGARVAEPAITVAPEEEKKAEAGKSAEEPTKSAGAGRTANARASSRSRPPARSTRTKPSKSARAETEKSSAETPTPKSEASAETEKKLAAPTSTTANETEKPAAAPATGVQGGVTPSPGAHLVIVETDGTRIDRPMSTIRRVVIDNGLIVVFLKNGKIERFAMSDVARMTIEP